MFQLYIHVFHLIIIIIFHCRVRFTILQKSRLVLTRKHSIEYSIRMICVYWNKNNCVKQWLPRFSFDESVTTSAITSTESSSVGDKSLFVSSVTSSSVPTESEWRSHNNQYGNITETNFVQRSSSDSFLPINNTWERDSRKDSIFF